MFRFTEGLFKFDFTDHHAILGVSLDAKFPEIRKRYMRVARRLHPDTCPFENEKDKEFANQLLSKLVSPAYNKFSKESNRTELFVILNKLSNTVTQKRSQIEFTTDAAKQIAKGGNYQEIYKGTLQELSDRQYESLDKTLEITAEISELNLAYLLRSKNGVDRQPPPPPVQPPVNQEKSTTVKSKGQNPLVEQACSRAESLISTKNYAKAILELKDALKIEPNHSGCHALLGLCYLQQNQGTMAKIQVKKALSLNPKEPKALEVKKLLEQAATGNNNNKKKGTGKVTAKTAKKGNKTDKGGGLFGGFFGGNKK